MLPHRRFYVLQIQSADSQTKKEDTKMNTRHNLSTESTPASSPTPIAGTATYRRALVISGVLALAMFALISIAASVSARNEQTALLAQAPQADYGDAPDNQTTHFFPTLYTTTNAIANRRGPFHQDISQEWIGASSTAETDARVVDLDIDDGKPFVFVWLVSLPAPTIFSVDVSIDADADTSIRYLNVLIDHNNDNEWSLIQDPFTGEWPEWIMRNVEIEVPNDIPPGESRRIQSEIFGFSPDLLLFPVWVRATLTTEPISESSFPYTQEWDGSGPRDGFVRGETEDYFITFDSNQAMRTHALTGTNGMTQSFKLATCEIVPHRVYLPETGALREFHITCINRGNEDIPQIDVVIKSCRGDPLYLHSGAIADFQDASKVDGQDLPITQTLGGIKPGEEQTLKWTVQWHIGEPDSRRAVCPWKFEYDPPTTEGPEIVISYNDVEIIEPHEPFVPVVPFDQLPLRIAETETLSLPLEIVHMAEHVPYGTETITSAWLPEGATFLSGLSETGHATAGIEWTPGSCDSGWHDIIYLGEEVTTESYSSSTPVTYTARYTIPVHVLNTNRAPSAIEWVNELLNNTAELPLQWRGVDNDMDECGSTDTTDPGDGLRFTATFSSSHQITTTDQMADEEGIVTFDTIPTGETGPHTIVLTATDLYGAQVTEVFTVEIVNPGTVVLPDMGGVAFEQIDYTWDSASPIPDSSTGKINVNNDTLLEATNMPDGGYLNMRTSHGWVVRNLPIIPDFSYGGIATFFNLGIADGTEVSTLDTYLLLAPEPLMSFNEYPTSHTFQITPHEYNAQGVAWTIPIEEQDAPDQVLQITKVTSPTRYIQEGHRNIEAETNQCLPAAIANSLEWISNTHGISMPHRNVPGGNGDDSLVSQLDEAMERKPGETTSIKAGLEGKLTYLGQNGINNIQTKHHGFFTDNITVTLPGPDGETGTEDDVEMVSEWRNHSSETQKFTKLMPGEDGKYGTDDDRQEDFYGHPISPDFILNELLEGEDVELISFYHDARVSHAVEVIGYEIRDGKPCILYVSDHVQGDNTRGTEGPPDFACLEDRDNDGHINLAPTDDEFESGPEVLAVVSQSPITPTDTIEPEPEATSTPTVTPTSIAEDDATPTPTVTPTSIADDDATTTPTSTPTATPTSQPYTRTQPITTTWTGDKEGKLKSEDSNTEITFPPGAVDGEATARHEELSEPSAPPPAGTVPLRVFKLDVFDKDGRPITQFNHPYTLTVRYTPADLDVYGVSDPQNLRLAYYDSETGEWVILPTTVNTADQTVTVMLDHLTEFALIGYVDPSAIPTATPTTVPLVEDTPVYLPLIQR